MVMQQLRVGMIGESIIKVTDAESARIMGSGALDVFATPAMIALMEAASVAAIDPFLDSRQASVGIHLDVKHIAATPLGERVTAIAEITHIEDQRVTLEVRAWDEHDMIGEGRHIRYIIDIDRFMQRISSDNR